MLFSNLRMTPKEIVGILLAYDFFNIRDDLFLFLNCLKTC
jgi:hypothetical protein